jgi:hypothetical protein
MGELETQIRESQLRNGVKACQILDGNLEVLLEGFLAAKQLGQKTQAEGMLQHINSMFVPSLIAVTIAKIDSDLRRALEHLKPPEKLRRAGVDSAMRLAAYGLPTREFLRKLQPLPE